MISTVADAKLIKIHFIIQIYFIKKHTYFQSWTNTFQDLILGLSLLSESVSSKTLPSEQHCSQCTFFEAWSVWLQRLQSWVRNSEICFSSAVPFHGLFLLLSLWMTLVVELFKQNKWNKTNKKAKQIILSQAGFSESWLRCWSVYGRFINYALSRSVERRDEEWAGEVNLDGVSVEVGDDAFLQNFPQGVRALALSTLIVNRHLWESSSYGHVTLWKVTLLS